LAPERRDPHRMLDTRAAWLKDPDGNVLEILGG
jgi:hypothetical protein